MRSSIPLYNALAADYDVHFEVPHRRAYDDLAWEFVLPFLPDTPGQIIDAGCGVGRWAERLVALGHYVIGIEQTPARAAAARNRWQTDRFRLVERSIEEVEPPEGEADLVLALGSLQYTLDPEQIIEYFAHWVSPGGSVVVLVDSLVALVLELIASGKDDEALVRLQSRMGTWVLDGQQADNHLFDRERLENAFRRASLTEVCSKGLLVGASALGRDELTGRLTNDWEAQLTLERTLAQSPLLADLGKQLLVSGRRRRL
ncbi:MAG: class I SAM-dependent methyltransferase [Chloroflexota bacterium]